MKTEIETCLKEFSKLNTDGLERQPWEDTLVEVGFDCQEQTYEYQGQPPVIASHRFEVEGSGERAVTQFLQVDLGYEFIFASGIAVLVK